MDFLLVNFDIPDQISHWTLLAGLPINLPGSLIDLVIIYPAPIYTLLQIFILSITVLRNPRIH